MRAPIPHAGFSGGPPGKTLTGPLHGMGQEEKQRLRPLEMGPGAWAVQAGGAPEPTAGSGPQVAAAPQPGAPCPSAAGPGGSREGRGASQAAGEQVAWQWRAPLVTHLAWRPHRAHSPGTNAADAAPGPTGRPRDCAPRPACRTGPRVPGRKLGHGAKQGAAPRSVGLTAPRCLAPRQCLCPRCSFRLAPPPTTRLAFSAQTTPSEGPAPKEPPQQNFITDRATVNLWGAVTLQGRGLLATPYPTCGLYSSLSKANNITCQHV